LNFISEVTEAVVYVWTYVDIKTDLFCRDAC